MTSHTGRLYAVAAAVTTFFVLWAVIAAAPWRSAAAPPSAQDPRVAQLAAREQQLRREAAHVRQVVKQRWAAYRVKLKARKHQIAAIDRQNRLLASQAAAPAVNVVTLPALTSTRTS